MHVPFVSQPSEKIALQSFQPDAHEEITHVELEHATALAWGTDGQALPQLPQFERLVVVFVSQPSEKTPLQSAQPAVHEEILHVELEHITLAWGTDGQAWPQLPQFCALAVVSTHVFPHKTCPD